jgi:thioredoxin
LARKDVEQSKLKKMKRKKISILFAFLIITLSAFASKPIAMDKQMFLEKVFDYESGATEWKYKGDKPAIINFWASWCGPCRILARTLTQIATEFDDEIYVYKINVDEQSELAAAFGVRNLPFSLFVPMEGVPQSALGALSRRALRNNVNTILLNK